MAKGQDNKCAPTKEYSEGSCFTMKDLKKMAYSFNIHIENSKIKSKKITILDNKKHLLKELTSRLENICNDQICWLKQDFIKSLKDKNILETFRPKGPEGKFEWLSTTHINNVMEQYEKKYKDFKFFGAIPIDFDDLPFLGIKDLNYESMLENGKNKLGFVFNLDEHWKSGSHWVALYCDLLKNQIYFFDSYGSRPEKRIRRLVGRIEKFMYNRNHCKNKCEFGNDSDNSYMMTNHKNNLEKKLDVEYNQNRHQYKNSECGVYSLNFILRLLNGHSFDDISKKKVLDDDINECRDTYFTFSKPFSTLK